jgi:hypothetical protein
VPLRPCLAFRLAIAVLVLASLSATVVGAQSTADSTRRVRDTLSLDSLQARLARAEAAIALLREQVASESQSAVHSRSRIRVELSAQVLTNSFATFGRVNNVDVPQTVLAPPASTATPATNDATGFTLRQTRLGAAASVDDVLGATLASDIDFDLFGGVQNGAGDRRLFPEPRLRTARARLTWSRTELMIGAETPLISDLNPISLASVGIPDFSAAGNLWNWLGQVRLTRELAVLGGGASRVRWAIQGAVMSPFTNTIAPGEPDAVDAGERSRLPAVEGRMRGRWGTDAEGDGTIAEGLIGSRGGEVGVGFHRGSVATGVGSRVASYAFSVDGHAVIARGVELRGEWYSGRLLRGLGGGGIAQNFGRAAPAAPAGSLGPPIRDQAGWLQLNVQPHPLLLAGVGCGTDVANANDSPTRLQNTVCALHAEWRPMQPLVMGAEYRQLGTRFATGTYGARHVNVFFGFEW